MVYQNPPPYNPQTEEPLPNPAFMEAPPSYAPETSIFPDIAPSYSDRTPLSVRGNLKDEKFNNGTHRDVFFTILFVIHLIGLAVITVFGVLRYIKENPQDRAEDLSTFVITPSEWATLKIYIGICFAAAGLAVIFSFIYFQIVKRFPRQSIIVTLIISIFFWMTISVIFFVQGQWIAGVVLAVCAMINAIFFYSWRDKIPFAAIVLETVMNVVQEYPATIHTAYLSLIIHLAFVVLWTATVVLAQNFSQSVFAGLFVFLLLSLYWTSQVIKNVVHVTVSGTVATWYFMKGTVGIPANPTLLSFRRATTTSFGSICLGSLLVAALQTLKAVVQILLNGRHAILSAIAQCLLSCIDSLIQYFNKYAFTQVAIYGKSYVRAARDTWELIKTHGVEAIINDNLISGVLTIGSLLGAVLSAILAGVLGLVFLHDYWASCAGAGFLIGLSIVIVVMEIIDSGVATIFVSFALDHEALKRSDPVLYQKFRERYGSLPLVWS